MTTAAAGRTLVRAGPQSRPGSEAEACLSLTWRLKPALQERS
jgi:hypothetical protein